MKKFFSFNPIYFFLAVGLFLIEILIAKYLNDSIIRPYGGDFLVVILIYCFVRSFLNFSILYTAIGVLLFSFIIETLQYLDIVTKLGLEKSTLARTVIGTSFEWIDLIAYTLGIITVIVCEYWIRGQTVLSTTRKPFR
jgi:hypothetical protein